MATLLHVRAPARESAGESTDTVVIGAATNLVGRKVGSYTVLRELGQGGMGCVYLAEHDLIGRKAAIKVLNPDIASDPEVVSRFFTEARAVNDIRHPNIVEVTDFGQFGSLYCIVMEFLEGETLAARLTRIRTFDEPSVIRIMKQCTSALGAAHEQGLVHRDIKPENIFLRAHPDYPDFVKLLDFGIAKLLTSDASVGHHTKTGSVLGTPSYMSPEQCLGEAALDIRSDVYSLGVVIYQMLTGMLPFTGDTLGRLIVCHVSEAPVPPCLVNAAISRPMNDLILRAMQKNPRDRYQSARDMREALERVAAPPPRSPPPVFGVREHGGVVASSQRGGPGSGPVNRSAPTAQLRPGRPTNHISDGGFPGEGRSTPTTVDIRQIPAAGLMGGAGSIAGGSDVASRMTTIVLDRISGGQLDLPDLPGATVRCIELARSGRLGFTDAANIIKEVPALRSRIMKLANSPAFPSLMPATTMELAVGRLGTKGLYTALIEFAARDTLEGRHPRVKEAMRRIWPHALGTATLTAELCQLSGQGSEAGDGYLAGLLADVGKPVVGLLLVDMEQQMQRAGQRTPLPEPAFLAIMERCAHLAGAAVARHWELAPTVAEAIEGSRSWKAREPAALSNLVRFAGLLTARLGLTVGIHNGPDAERAFLEGRGLLKLEESGLKGISHGFKERITSLAGIRG